MEWGLLTVLTIVGLTVFMGLVQAVVFPPVEISAEDVPTTVSSQLRSTFPRFNEDKILYSKIARSYTFEGKWEQASCRIKIELAHDGEFDELEFKRLQGPTRIANKSKISLSVVPANVADVLHRFFKEDPAKITACRVYSGMIGNESAFEIKFHFGGFKYEFEVTESGQLVEFEKERRRQQT